MRGFAVWLQATDGRTQVAPQRLLPAQYRRPTPHICGDREIVDLIAAAGQLRSASGLRVATFKALLGLLAATGLRPGEALALDVSDVDLVGGVLAVVESKFGKSRFVPMQESTRVALAAYAKFRDTARRDRDSPAFLVTARGRRLGACAVRRAFAELCQIVGLRPRLEGRRIGRGPRLQDFRHSFATCRLIELYRAGHDVDRLMPRLATYLGHVSTTETYWYIQGVPELLRLASRWTSMCLVRSRSGSERCLSMRATPVPWPSSLSGQLQPPRASHPDLHDHTSSDPPTRFFYLRSFIRDVAG